MRMFRRGTAGPVGGLRTLAVRWLAWAVLSMVLPASAQPPASPEARIEWNIKLPMRDGVALSATLYHPAGAATKRPTILTITPYTADRYHDRGMFFAAHGYSFVVVDVRGRGNSDGEFRPYEQDGHDGHDVVEWITRQRWSDGKVGMWGGSYAGFNQWATLKEFPKGLKTIVPTAAPYLGYDFPAYKNVFSVWIYQWLVRVSGRSLNAHLSDDLDHWTRLFRAHYLAGAPFEFLDERAGVPSPAFDRWLAHPSADASRVSQLDVRAYQRIDVPILTITGHYDGVQRGALEHYRRHMQHGSASGRSQHYVLIGPWNHGGTRKPGKQVGGLQVGEASLIDIDGLHLQWYNWTLRGGKRPDFLRDQVTYYTTGSEQWRHAPSLDWLGTAPRRMYLQATDSAADATHAGGLDERAAAIATRSYRYDPRDLRAGRVEPVYGEQYLLDASPVKDLFGAGLVYDSSQFAEDATIAGRIKATLWISMDVPDTDIELTLYELRPDGTSLRLTQDLVRARYRDSLHQARPVPMNEPVRYEFPDFAFFARRIARGHRLRLLIRAPNSIYLQKNHNTGGDVAKESVETARVANVTVHHGGRLASFIELPIARD